MPKTQNPFTRINDFKAKKSITETIDVDGTLIEIIEESIVDIRDVVVEKKAADNKLIADQAKKDDLEPQYEAALVVLATNITSDQTAVAAIQTELDQLVAAGLNLP